MKSFNQIKKKLIKNKKILKKKYKLKKIGIFGSYIKNMQKKTSDVDILIEYTEPPTLFEVIELEDYLVSIIGSDVDLVFKKSLKPHIGKQILKEVVYI